MDYVAFKNSWFIDEDGLIPELRKKHEEKKSDVELCT